MTAGTAAAAPSTAGRVTTATADLDHGLRAASKFISRRAKNPALAAIVFDFTPGHLTVTASDYDTFYSRTFDVDGDLVAKLAVPATEVTPAVSRLTSRAWHVELAAKSDGLLISHPAGDVHVARLNPNDEDNFPDRPAISWGRPVTLTYRQWADLFRVNATVGTDDMLPVLTGIHLVNENGSLTASGTDRFRLSLATTDAESDHSWTALVPAVHYKRVLDAFKPAKADLDTTMLTVEVDDAQHFLAAGATHGAPRWIRVTGADAVADVHVLEGDFPRLRSIFGPNAEPVGTTARADLRTAVKAAAAVVDVKQDPLEIVFADEQVTVTAYGAKTTVNERLAGTRGPGEDGTVAITAQLLVDGLNALAGDDITFSRHKTTGPIRISDGDETFTYVVMPLRPGRAERME
ncbi:hypothetical protein [Paenarthrobacter sp. C1]|uniref:DNA polymerase III subunit beta family protein n=1 Tax=Paenarthrobacter sp. C1 TaxID=3400220 RepID=UPI003BF48698